MRILIVSLWLGLAGIAPAAAQVTFGFSSGPVSIGINVPTYPQLVPVPGYPVYYAPGVNSNYFFYDGLYWVFTNDGWYQSNWYNGPWYPVDPNAVPVFLLRVPVRYYHHPPAYFRGWRADAAPHWDEHWGRGWADHHRDWNHWDRGHAPARAPLPTYQRRYAGDRYPRDEAQAAQAHAREYHYQPRDQAVQQHYQRYQQASSGQPHEQRGGPYQRGAQNHDQRAPQAQHEQRPAQPREQHAPQAHEERGGGRENPGGGHNDFRNDHGQNSGG